MPPDSELLLSYARHQSQAAFAELVRAHIDLVYSAALRRASGDPHAAAEITQEVFIAMARHAERLARHPVLNAWLHASTHNAAANLHRRERRRERQKQQVQAMQELHSLEGLSEEWNDVHATLDSALDDLSNADRQVIILRFFENRSYPVIGGILGLREEAVRMRVGRALEKLRTRLACRGITSTATALGGALTAHAVIGAPAGLAATVTAANVSLAAAAPTIGLIHFMTLSKASVSLFAAAAIISVGAFVHLRRANAELGQTKADPLSFQPIAALAAGGEKPRVDLATLVKEKNATRALVPSAATMEAEEKIAALREVLARLPEQSIPELRLATSGDWHVAVDGNLETTDDYRRALAKIRSLAESRFGKLVQPALRAYLQANDGQFPTGTAQLQSFVGERFDDGILQRYRIAPSSEIKNVRMGGDWIITQSALIDSEHDNHLVIGPNGFGSCSSLQSSSARDTAMLMPAMKAYHAANGERFADISQLMPYATTPEQRAIIQKLALEQ